MRRSLICLISLLGLLVSDTSAQETGTQGGGGISFAGAKIVTPDSAVNALLREGRLNPASVVDIRVDKEGTIINPVLRKGWTWVAARGIKVNDTPVSFFFLDGRLYSDVPFKTAHRRMKFQKNVSSFIRSQAFVVAFYRQYEIERELVMFAWLPDGRVDSVQIGKEVFGEEKTIALTPDNRGKAFVSVLKMADEFRPWYVEENDPVTRERVLLNHGWRFQRGDVPKASEVNVKTDQWERVDIPHCWNATDLFDQRNVYDGYEINNGYYRGPGWYRKEFTLERETRGKRVWVSFEGAFQKADVWLNGKNLGKHVGGYTGFSFEISGSLLPAGGRNVLAVRVDNSFDKDIPPHTADYAMYGGLYRDVFLTTTETLALAGEVAAVPKVRSRRDASLSVSATVDNASGKTQTVEVKHLLVNKGNEIVASFGQPATVPAGAAVTIRQESGRIAGVQLWSPDRPELYTLRTQIIIDRTIIDEVKSVVGFRWYSFHPDSGFFLNGEPLKLKGVNRHQDHPMLGIALPDSMHLRDMVLIKELGANFVRLAHYPQDPSVLAACDSLGLLVWEEIPVVNSVGDAEFSSNAKLMMREMITRDMNHPSIILWGIANECLADYAESGVVGKVKSLLQDLHALIKELDPSRLSVQAHNDLRDESVADITDVLGRNRYFGWYTEKMTDFSPTLEEEHRQYPRRVLLISEYGAESKRGYHVDDPRRFDHSEDYQLQFHEYYWETIKSKPYVAGSLVWAAFDFGSPYKIGNIPRINQKGIWDGWRKPKDLYYFYKSQWTADPMVYIVSHTRRECSGQIGRLSTVRVYSNCDTVELFVNGKTAGKLEKKGVYVWDVALNGGSNTLHAVGTSPTRIVEDKIQLRYTVE